MQARDNPNSVIEPDYASCAAVIVEGAALGAFASGAGQVLGQLIVRGPEYWIGPNLRVAPFGNKRYNPGSWRVPHYHRSRPNPMKPGDSLPGQGIKRHRPWESKQKDTTFWDRF